MRTIELREPCVFLQIGISRMGDKRGISSDEIEVDADKDLVKARKVIFKSPQFDRIKSLDSEIRRYVRGICFPYESGLHMVPARLVDCINEQLTAYHNHRFSRIMDFAHVWPAIRDEFPDKLRKLYDSTDYEVGDVASNFSMSWNFLQLKTPTDIDAISAEILKGEEKKFKTRMDDAYEEARMILRETCLGLVTHLRTSLEADPYGAPKRISASTVIKLQEFLKLFDLRNITNDTLLQEHVRSLNALLNGADAESLRSYDAFRNRVRHELSGVEDELKEAVVVAPSRRIKGI